MLRAVFHRKSWEFGGQYFEPFFGFEISGHAGYGEAVNENEGNDIVCAAISSCAMLVCNAITDQFGANAEVKVEENRISLNLNEFHRGSSKLIAALHEHLMAISEDHSKVKVDVD